MESETDLAFLVATKEDADKIYELYQKVIKSTFTTWDESYPSKPLVIEDIEHKNLYVLKLGNEIVAVSFLGKNENEDDAWNYMLNNGFGLARICVSPDFQRRGIGTRFLKLLIDEAKRRGSDGLHFHVCVQNLSAIKMYEKAGFENCGLGKPNYGFEFYKFEMVF